MYITLMYDFVYKFAQKMCVSLCLLNAILLAHRRTSICIHWCSTELIHCVAALIFTPSAWLAGLPNVMAAAAWHADDCSGDAATDFLHGIVGRKQFWRARCGRWTADLRDGFRIWPPIDR